MFVGDKIEALVDLFDQREVSLLHSCQLIDFQSYIRLGGIPSRKLLEDCHLAFTKFETDCLDRTNGVWDKVFLNLQDFGAIFASGSMGVPTVYGPITVAMSPSVLRSATDVAICLRSAGISGFQREYESLQTIEEVKRLFYHDINNHTANRSALKNRQQLRKEYGIKAADYISYPEISCTVPESKLSLSFTRYLLVDPYRFGDKSLKEIVEDKLSLEKIPVKVLGRSARQNRYELYDEISAIVQKEINTIDDFLKEDVSPNLRALLKRLQTNSNHRTQWRRYTKYLLEGTLREL